MNTLKNLVLLTLLAIATNAIAVENEGGIRFLLGEPTGEFGEAVDNLGVGVEVHYGVRPQPALTFGIGLNAMIYGSETTSYSLPLVEDFDLTTSNNLAGGFFFAQLRPLTGPIQPYAEARAGINYLWTESKLEDEDWWDDDEVARKTNYDDFAKYWGAGGGLLIRLSEGDSAKKTPGVFLDLKVTYLKGSEADYLTEGDISLDDDNQPVYAVSESETDFTTYEVGVVLTF